MLFAMSVISSLIPIPANPASKNSDSVYIVTNFYAAVTQHVYAKMESCYVQWDLLPDKVTDLGEIWHRRHLLGLGASSAVF